MTETIRVLIADDDAFMVESLRGILVLSDLADFSVDSVSEADQVLAKIRATRPDVVVLDDRFGEEKVGIRRLMPKIRGEYEAVGVVIITAHRGHDTGPMGQAMAWGIDGFLDKPIDPDEFSRAVLDSYAKSKARGQTHD